MTKPQSILISSTCHDLGDLRDFLDYELTRHGFTTVLSDKGTVPVHSDKHSYENCLDAARDCDVTLGVIGGRFGGEYDKSGKSITQMEVETAVDAGKKVFVVARHSVLAAKEILRPYAKARIKFRPSNVVEDERVFTVIDGITKLKTGNWIHQFVHPHEILEYLSDQLGFKLLPSSPEGAERLDQMIARRFLDAFPPGLVDRVYADVQGSALQARAMDALEDGWTAMAPDHLRFCDDKCSQMFDTFMRHTWRVLDGAPALFKSGINPNLYIERYTHERGPDPKVVEMREELIEHAEQMALAWRGLLEQIKRSWPAVLAELIDTK